MIDMGEIQKITISGFRGINAPPVELDFQKGMSMIVYGTNGSGKSSIVDAWEWLFSGKIEHLAREGAKEHAYPHKEAKPGQTWIEVDFTKTDIGKIRVEFNPNRVTLPKVKGNLPEMKRIIPHPCHFRYRDLAEFVYQTKSKKYELLSSLMGFGEAIDIQNQLKTASNSLATKTEELKRDRETSIKEYHEVSGENPCDRDRYLKSLNVFFNRQKVESVNEMSDVNSSVEKLRFKVENDENSRRLSFCKDTQRVINQFYPVKDIRSDIAKFQSDLAEFKKDEKEISKLILLDLYEKGIEAVEFLKAWETCPLCDQPYEGSLLEYIKHKYDSLIEFNKKRRELEKLRKNILLSIDEILKKIESSIIFLEQVNVWPQIRKFNENLNNLIVPIKECRNELEKAVEDINLNFNFLAKIDTSELKSTLNSENEIKEYVLSQINILEKNQSRKALVDDFQHATKVRDSFVKWNKLNRMILRLEEIKANYEKIKTDYVDETKKSVQDSFDSISSDVAAYFKVLERDNATLGDPKLNLYSDSDKAVELEVMFGGETIRPAYKFLSESQLNSFGLSIFLASAKNFNHNFKFVILDDVINSFDTYKRPRVIDLLSTHFSEYQILLLTHDSIWLDRLQKSFPTWRRVHFVGWDYHIGPRVKTGMNTYEQINESLSEARPTEAGWNLGRYLEWRLQELCENLEASVKFNRRNEYTLSQLFQAFKARMKDKLGSSHTLVKQISDFEADSGFRNFCDHWKNSETDYTCPEIRDIVQKWRDIETQIECGSCNKLIIYEKVDKYEHISCPCRNLKIK